MGDFYHRRPFPRVGHFTACTPNINPATLPGTDQYQYPIALPLADAMRWYWRVKNWQANANLTATYGSDPPISGDSETTGTRESGGSPIIDEAELVCGDNSTSIAWDAEVLAGDPPEPQILYTGGAVILEASNPAIVPLLFWDGNYYPYINVGTTLIDILIAETPQSDPPQLATELTLTIDGHVVPLYYVAISAGGVPSGTIDIYPVEYWPYDPGDGGGPVWDTSTGALLRPDMIT